MTTPATTSRGRRSRSRLQQKKMRALGSMLVAVTATLAFVATATAEPPTVGAIVTTVTSDVVVSARQAGPNLVITEDRVTNSLTGAFTGTALITYSVVIHADGSGQAQGRGTFTGTVAGCGSVTMEFNLQFSASASGEVEGTSDSIDGSPVTFHDVFTGTSTSPIFAETSRYHC